MANFGSIVKTPYDTITDVIEKWCQDNYYGNFIVTLRINGELCTEYLIYETGDPDRLDPHWVWESDWWEGQKDIELVGFLDINSVRVSGTPDYYKFITMEEQMLTENICCNYHWYKGEKAVPGMAPWTKYNKQVDQFIKLDKLVNKSLIIYKSEWEVKGAYIHNESEFKLLSDYFAIGKTHTGKIEIVNNYFRGEPDWYFLEGEDGGIDYPATWNFQTLSERKAEFQKFYDHLKELEKSK